MNITKKVIRLTGWEIAGFWPWTPLFGSSAETGDTLAAVTPWIDAAVPGSVYNDLRRAGLISDPYYEQNSLLCEWVANRWWVYRNTFSYERSPGVTHVELVFKGVDYKATFFLNGMELGSHEGMYTACAFDVTGLLREGENHLRVVFAHAPDEMSQIGYTERTHTQKSRCNYKWDFSTRLVGVGLYDDVVLEETGDARLRDVFIRPADESCGAVLVTGRLEGSLGNVTAACSFEGRTVSETSGAAGSDGEFRLTLPVSRPHLWFPNGHGAQPLYDFVIRAYDLAGGISDEFTLKTGLRSISLMPNEGAPSSSLPYTFVVNGKKIYCKGVNLVPLDLEYGCVTLERYEAVVSLMKRSNVNLVRVWGGGMIEKEDFYSLCDRYGIMVWQEFIQSSSGISNQPSTDPAFLRLLKKTAEFTVRQKRNHACHVVWSGGNELMTADGIPVGFENPNIAMLRAVVGRLDPGKPMLPTSASGPVEGLDINAPGKNHDVHGPWKYGGVEGHYEMYNRSDSQFHSEFGCDGMSCRKTLETFLSGKNIGVFDMNNLVWRHHGEWWDTLPRDRAIFGDFDDIDDQITASQFIQAEAVRYALESNRSRAFRNSGSIVWQFNEPWPNVSNTCLVDYTLTPKPAYYLAGVAYRPVHACLGYHQLVYAPGETFEGDLRLLNDTGTPHDAEVTVTVSGGAFSQDFRLTANAASPCVALKKLSFPVPEGECFEIRLRLSCGGLSRENRYLMLIRLENGLCSQRAVRRYMHALAEWAEAPYDTNMIKEETNESV